MSFRLQSKFEWFYTVRYGLKENTPIYGLCSTVCFSFLRPIVCSLSCSNGLTAPFKALVLFTVVLVPNLTTQGMSAMELRIQRGE